MDYSGQHTYSENRRFVVPLRLNGFLILTGIGVGIAGGVLGIQKNANASLSTALRRASVCIFAGAYVILFLIEIGSWTYRWHLRTYRLNVSYLFYTRSFIAS